MDATIQYLLELGQAIVDVKKQVETAQKIYRSVSNADASSRKIRDNYTAFEEALTTLKAKVKGTTATDKEMTGLLTKLDGDVTNAAIAFTDNAPTTVIGTLMTRDNMDLIDRLMNREHITEREKKEFEKAGGIKDLVEKNSSITLTLTTSSQTGDRYKATGGAMSSMDLLMSGGAVSGGANNNKNKNKQAKKKETRYYLTEAAELRSWLKEKITKNVLDARLPSLDASLAMIKKVVRAQEIARWRKDKRTARQAELMEAKLNSDSFSKLKSQLDSVIAEYGVGALHMRDDLTNPTKLRRSAKSLFYKSLDREAVDSSIKELEQFRKTISSDDFAIQVRMQNYVTGIEANMERFQEEHARVVDEMASPELDAMSKSQKQLTLKNIEAEMSKYIVKSMKMLRKLSRDFVTYHADFLGTVHNKSFQYMVYWKGIDSDYYGDNYSESEKADIERYFERYFEEAQGVTDDSTALFGEIRTNAVHIATDYNSAIAEEDLIMPIEDAMEDATMGIDKDSLRVQDMYAGGGVHLRDRIFNMRFGLLYLLKAVRVPLFYLALYLTRKAFEERYHEAVYAKSANPPHLAWFVLVLVAIDFFINVILLVLLLVLRYLFKTRHNDFPVDGNLIAAFAADYLLTTLVVAAVAAVVAFVMYDRKYFRYKYEGKRAIAALRDASMSIFLTFIFLPFFLITH